jgi:integrase/recombinase XerD
LAIAFDTGARNTEICSIMEADIKDNVILIHGKGNKERHVPLTPYLKKAVMKYQRIKKLYFENKHIPYQNLLLSRTGRPLTKEAVEHVFHQAASKAEVRSNIRCSPHTARHYYAQTNLRNGLDVYSLSRLLGHENINITKRYLQSLQDSSIVEMAVNTSPLRNVRI